MATIDDKGTYFQLLLNPNVENVELIDKPKEGYEATIGINEEGKHVISRVNYLKQFIDSSGNKKVRTIQDVLSKIDDLKNCSRCSTLDKENLTISSISTNETTGSGFVSTVSTNPTQSQVQPTQQLNVVSSQPIEEKTKSMKDVFADQFFNAYLTTPGKYIFGMMFGDENMISDAMPIDSKSQSDFIGEMVDFISGDIGLMRSPDEAKEYLSVLKQSEDEKSKPGSVKFNRNRRLYNNIIY
uniref:Uncharacterized protein n=1 Tax=viral metagenome TaxID=1070528 RepID=A0A6M3X5J2_9ZZZZ